jgi:hypothetical protein
MPNQFIDITNRKELKRLLQQLEPGTIPLWGSMKPQQMIEHLAEQVRWSNGKKIATCDQPAGAAAASKHKMIYTDAEITRNIFLGVLPEQYTCANISEAIDQLMFELADFDNYFKTQGITAIHGGFGAMNHEEWITWHGKHFTHHLKQFGLLPAAV